jgi:hypothetical protein
MIGWLVFPVLLVGLVVALAWRFGGQHRECPGCKRRWALREDQRHPLPWGPADTDSVLYRCRYCGYRVLNQETRGTD